MSEPEQTTPNPKTDAATLTASPFGTMPDGAPVERYTLANAVLSIDILTYGGRVQRLRAPDRQGRAEDIVLGYDDLAGYLADQKTYFGALIGRYGNRIALGRFELDGHSYQAPINDPPNSLHGGTVGFDQRLWQARRVDGGLHLALTSEDGDQGYPGTLTAEVRYTLHGSALHIDYSATTTRPTVLNLTNHTYFNLAGQGSGSVLDQVGTIAADRYTPVGKTMIPTGIAEVAGTPFDFRDPTPIGARIGADNEQLRFAGGYDHNFCLGGPAGERKLAARVHDPATGRTLTVHTTEPGIQFYTGNSIPEPVHGKAGAIYRKRAAFCLETQHYPDSPNHPGFPSTVLRPDETYLSSTIFSFTAE